MMHPPLRNPHSRPSFFLPVVLLLALTPLTAFARSSQDHASFGSDITISEGEGAADVACAFCSVHIHGDVRGDVAVAFGSVTVDSGRTISGDVAILGGDLHLADDSHVGGDVAIAAGNLDASAGATVHGDRAIFPGQFWLLIPFLPLLIVIGIIWLIVSLVRRNRYQFPAYPKGRRM